MYKIIYCFFSFSLCVNCPSGEHIYVRYFYHYLYTTSRTHVTVSVKYVYSMYKQYYAIYGKKGKKNLDDISIFNYLFLIYFSY